MRATGAGAGCGSHWPLCNGEVIPRSPRLETVVEFTHRLSSGLLGIFAFAFVVVAFRVLPAGHPARKGASVSMFFVLTEALIGAGLVRFEWVAANVSQERVYVMAFHLVNTFFLLAAMTLTAWFVVGERRMVLRRRPGLSALLALALGAVLAVGASGAVTALGDTLVFTAGIAPEDSPLVAALVASRFYHPSLAIAAFVFVAAVVLRLSPRLGSEAKWYGRAAVLVFAAQLLLGAVNVLLRAPVWMQLLHLLVSDVLWILLILLAAEALRLPAAAPAAIVSSGESG